MYSPCTSTKQMKPKSKNDESKDRDAIMNIFYETELPELGVEYTEIPKSGSGSGKGGS